eukprot:SAG31_NODE_12272_length_953_cov_1.444965_2_plen_165_part_01
MQCLNHHLLRTRGCYKNPQKATTFDPETLHPERERGVVLQAFRGLSVRPKSLPPPQSLRTAFRSRHGSASAGADDCVHWQLEADLARGVVTPEEVPPSPSTLRPDAVDMTLRGSGRRRRCSEWKTLQHTRIQLRKNFTLAQRYFPSTLILSYLILSYLILSYLIL